MSPTLFHAPLSQRAGYTTAQIRLLFGHSDGMGGVIPLHENTIARWRKAGTIPYVRVNYRVFRYPREGVDALLREWREQQQKLKQKKAEAQRLLTELTPSEDPAAPPPDGTADVSSPIPNPDPSPASGPATCRP